ncbi:MAG: hypothetical protein IJN92_04600 [Lachnospiraceae bacterium]|nr:hypothetical protein [Lachnospiraceae bacterium]
MSCITIETNLTYEQLKQIFEANVTDDRNLFNLSKRNEYFYRNEPFFFGNISKDTFLLRCYVPFYGDGGNGIYGIIAEKDGKCIINYKRCRSDKLSKIGEGAFWLALIGVFSFLLWLGSLDIVINFELLKNLLLLIFLFLFFVLIFGIIFGISAKKQVDFCEMKLEEIIFEEHKG